MSYLKNATIKVNGKKVGKANLLKRVRELYASDTGKFKIDRSRYNSGYEYRFYTPDGAFLMDISDTQYWLQFTSDTYNYKRIHELAQFGIEVIEP